MRGLMQHDELTINRILERAVTFHPRRQIVTKTAAGIDRRTYEDLGDRTGRLRNTIVRTGRLPAGDEPSLWLGADARDHACCDSEAPPTRGARECSSRRSRSIGPLLLLAAT